MTSSSGEEQRRSDAAPRPDLKEAYGKAVASEAAKPRVVLVSSSAIVRYQIQRELVARHFVVIVKDDISAALTYAANADVVVVDAVCTSAAGQNAVRRLKEAVGRVPVLFLDDRAPVGDEHGQILRAGADGVVLRDDVDAIAATLHMYVSR